MKRTRTTVGIMALFLFVAVAAGGWAQSASGSEYPTQYQLGRPLVIGDPMNPYRYDGSDVRPILGNGSVEFDADSDQGYLSVEIQTTEESGPVVMADGVAIEGNIRFVMSRFYGPEFFMRGGIVANLLAYGDTGLLSDRMPEVLLDHVGWGWVDVYVNGEILYEDLVGQFMVSDRLRRRVPGAYTISRGDGTVYSPDLENKAGFEYTTQKEMHLFVANQLAGIRSSVEDRIWVHLNLLVEDPPEALATGGGGSADEDEGGSIDDDGGSQVTPGGKKGDNGIGNGEDDQPPGSPPVNDGSGSSKGNPGNKKK